METDVMQSATFYKLLAWFETNRKQVMYGVAAAIALGLIAWFFVWQQSQKAVRAEEALARAFVPQITGAASRADAPSAYLNVVKEHEGSEAAGRAMLMAGASLFAEGKYAEAHAQFQRFVREHGKSQFAGQAQLGIAASLEAQGKTEEAVTAYKAVVDRRSSEAVGSQAKYALARLYAEQNKPELALPLYEDVARTDPFGSVGSEAGMLAEELKQKYPHLAPPTPQQPAFSQGATNLQMLTTNSAPVETEAK